MESPDFVPLGTICVVKGNTKKLMVIARGLALQHEGKMQYYDYGACLYPEGLMGDQVIYFNHDAIQKTVHEGYADEDNELLLENLKENLKTVTLEKGNPPPYKLPEQAAGQK
jgi:hypothetical protein